MAAFGRFGLEGDIRRVWSDDHSQPEADSGSAVHLAAERDKPVVAGSIWNVWLQEWLRRKRNFAVCSQRPSKVFGELMSKDFALGSRS